MQQLLLKNVRYLLVLHLLFFSVATALGQGITVKGRVTGENNDALPGVTVLLKGTTTGTTTDPSGNYTLALPNGTGTLVVSFIGYTPQEVAVSDRTTINVSLVPDTKSLQEVVVVGYGVQKKETVTGSVAAVKGAELVKSPTVNLSNSLAGRLPGVVAVNRSGEPGYDGSAIRIRGSNTLNNNSALIVIDGIPGREGGLDRINPNDIESVSVLKDAAAAIYGSRAANGVILITTKRGKTGKPQLSYDFNQGFSQPTVIPDLTDAAEYTSMLNDLNVYELPVNEWAAATEAFKTTGVYTRPNGDKRNAPFLPADIELYRNGSDPWLHPNTDWYKATLKTWSPQTRHNMQVTGGTDNLKYLASLGYQNQDGYYKNSATGYKQYDLRVNLDATINRYIKATIGILGREEVRMFPTRPASAIFRMQMRGKPQEQAYWPNGLPGPDIENGENPVVITTDLSGYNRDTRDFFQTNGALDILIPGVEGLKFTGTAAIDKRLDNGKTWQIPWTLYQRGTGVDANGNPNLVATQRGPSEPRLDQGTSNRLNILLGGVFTYERKLNENHGITLLAGTNRETIKYEGFNAFRRYFISPAIDQMFAGGDLEKNNNGGAEERARINYFGRVAYNYKEKYLAEFLWRYDGSDIFPQQTRYGFFPGILAGWVISEENFFKNAVPAVNFLKLRGSWGQLGNDDVGRYAYLSTFGFRSYILNNIETKTVFETRIPNNTITWEVANNSNVGLEMQLLDNRISVELDAFYNKRTNILAGRSAAFPQSTGIIAPLTNFGEVSNKGFEYNIGYRGQVGEFKYNVSVNGGYAQNKIIFRDEAPGAPEWQRATGMPMFTFLTYQYDGVFKDQAEIDAVPKDMYKAIVNQLRPGDMKYKDVGGRDANGNFTMVPDGKITPDDQVRTNVTNIPPFQGGLVLGGSFKNFDLSVLFQGAAGAKQYFYTGEMGNIGNYLQYIHDNRWTVENPSSEHPRITNRGDQYYSFNNTYWLRDNDYIRLKNLELGYTLPEKLTSRAGINNFRVYVNGLNIFTWDKMKVYDPETDNTNGQYYPQSRILSAGASVTF